MKRGGKKRKKRTKKKRKEKKKKRERRNPNIRNVLPLIVGAATYDRTA